MLADDEAVEFVTMEEDGIVDSPPVHCTSPQVLSVWEFLRT